MDPIVLEQAIAPVLNAARRHVDSRSYSEAAELYKSALRHVRDGLGPCHLLIALVFELLQEVHQATGKDAKCRAIHRRVLVIRATCNQSEIICDDAETTKVTQTTEGGHNSERNTNHK